jgi:purine-cytosine permease-like protein
LDRRVLALSIASLATVLALWTNIADYENFLVLIGSVFVPMSAVLIVDFFVLSHGHWNLSHHAPRRFVMLVPWSMGFITYQLINPGYISWWVSLWMNVGRLIDFKAASWMSASLCSFFVAAAVTLAGGGVARITRRRRDRRYPA